MRVRAGTGAGDFAWLTLTHTLARGDRGGGGGGQGYMGRGDLTRLLGSEQYSYHTTTPSPPPPHTHTHSHGHTCPSRACPHHLLQQSPSLDMTILVILSQTGPSAPQSVQETSFFSHIAFHHHRAGRLYDTVPRARKTVKKNNNNVPFYSSPFLLTFEHFYSPVSSSMSYLYLLTPPPPPLQGSHTCQPQAASHLVRPAHD